MIFYNYLQEIHFKLDKLLIIGNGSNILSSDREYTGIVVSFKKVSDRIRIISSKTLKCFEKIVECYSGVMCSKLSNYLKDNNLTGGEALSTIPGTIGGVVSMNASCYDYVTSDYVSEVLVLHNNNVKWIKKEELSFGYRTSIIQKYNMIILKVRFVFLCGKKELIENKIRFLKSERSKKQPIRERSAGSVFKNINNIKAWELIERCKLKGFSYKNAMVSNKHANFIINNGNSGDDIYILMKIIKMIVKRVLDYDLETEWVLINF